MPPDTAPASAAGDARQSDAALDREARVLTRYLLGRDCPDDMAERYVAASRALRGVDARDARTAEFALRHPSLLPYIDAAAAVTGRCPLLRTKSQLMAAILEASPRFAAEFLDAPTTPAAAVWQIGAAGLTAALEIAIGVPLLLALEARRS